MCVHHSINIWELKPEYQAYSLYITVKAYRKLRPILRKTKMKATIQKRYGLPFFLFRYRKRRLFAVGFVFSIISIYGMSLFIWNIDVRGNQFYSDEYIVDFLNDNHIYKTIFKNQIDCEDIVFELRKNFEEITWVSAHIEGTNLIISIKENEEIASESKTDIEHDVGYDIIAEEAGKIVSIITRNGSPMVHEGDIVEVGDILVSGRMEILDDSKAVSQYKYVTADADIIIETEISYEDTEDFIYEKKAYTGLEISAEYVKFGNYIIEMPIYHTTDLSYDIVTKELYFAPEQQDRYQLSFGRKKFRYYRLIPTSYSKNELETILNDRFSIFCDDLSKNGVNIVEKYVTISYDETQGYATGFLIVHMKNRQMTEAEYIEVPVEIEEEGLTE